MKDLTVIWDGEAECFKPTPRFVRACNAEFVDDTMYTIEVREERSEASHRHLFAIVREAWMNLPDHLVDDYPTAEHLRKKALIATGHHDERRFACESVEEARKLLRFLKPVDEFAVYAVTENIVIERKAKSMSMKAMGKQTFRAAKDDVIGFCSALIGVKPSEVQESA